MYQQVNLEEFNFNPYFQAKKFHFDTTIKLILRQSYVLAQTCYD